MWANVLQFVDEEGTRVRDIHARAGTTSDSLAGLRRWRYVTIDPWPHDSLGGRAPKDSVVRLTPAGRGARTVWQPLADEIEARWRSRFDSGAIEDLAGALETTIGRLDYPLPHYLPVIHPTSNGKAAPLLVGPVGPGAPQPAERPDLSVLLSRVLLGFTLDFEAESGISLPVSANTLRVLDDSGVRVRDLPRLTGVSKEANAMVTGFLDRRGCAEVVADPSASRGKVVRLTAKGAPPRPSTAASWGPRKIDGRTGTAPRHWTGCDSASSSSPVGRRPVRARPCSAASCPTPGAGGPRRARRKRCPTIRWSSIGAATPTAVESGAAHGAFTRHPPFVRSVHRDASHW